MLEIKNLGFELGAKNIFGGLNLEVKSGERLGITGGEGSGKSTLLDIIAGRLLPTEGEVKSHGEVVSVNGNVYADFSELRMAEMTAIEKLKRALRGLRDENIILLLDDPTKNLEEDGIEWLIHFLDTRKKITAVVVSNNRYFLNKTCKKIIRLGNFDVNPIKLTGTENFPRIAPDDMTAPKVLEVEDLLKIRDGEVMFKHVGFTVRQGQKIALVGRNDAGKTKLLQILNDFAETVHSKDENLKGRVDFSDAVKIFYMPRVYSSTAAKIELENLQKSEANFLLLDNPTICLDLPMIQALERALREFSGTIIFADEDRAFIDAIATRIIDLTPNGTVDRISGYEDFLANETVRMQIQEKYKL